MDKKHHVKSNEESVDDPQFFKRVLALDYEIRKIFKEKDNNKTEEIMSSEEKAVRIIYKRKSDGVLFDDEKCTKLLNIVEEFEFFDYEICELVLIEKCKIIEV